MRYRRLARDYERRTANHEAMVYWATILIMTRRLARYETGQPAVKRWGGQRKPPPSQSRQQHKVLYQQALSRFLLEHYLLTDFTPSFFYSEY